MRSSPNRTKRYGVLVTLMLLNWLLLAYIFIWVDPDSISNILFRGSYLPMVLTVFGAFFWFLCIIFLSTKKALRWSVALTFFILLRLNGFGNVANGLLILGILLTIEYYLVIKNREDQFNKSKNATLPEQDK